jgi:pimeloyl-ACP methyl ester carboxylesterase
VLPGDISPVEAVRHYRGPVFVIAGMEDRYTPPEETRSIFAAAPGGKRLWLVPRRGHAAIAEMRDEAYHERVRHFLHETIGPP